MPKSEGKGRHNTFRWAVVDKVKFFQEGRHGWPASRCCGCGAALTVSRMIRTMDQHHSTSHLIFSVSCVHSRRDDERFGGSSRFRSLLPPPGTLGTLGTKWLRLLLQRVWRRQDPASKGGKREERIGTGAAEDGVTKCSSRLLYVAERTLTSRALLPPPLAIFQEIRQILLQCGASESSQRRGRKRGRHRGNKCVHVRLLVQLLLPRKGRRAPAEIRPTLTSRVNGAHLLTLNGSFIEVHCKDRAPVSVANRSEKTNDVAALGADSGCGSTETTASFSLAARQRGATITVQGQCRAHAPVVLHRVGSHPPHDAAVPLSVWQTSEPDSAPGTLYLVLVPVTINGPALKDSVNLFFKSSGNGYVGLRCDKCEPLCAACGPIFGPAQDALVLKFRS